MIANRAIHRSRVRVVRSCFQLLSTLSFVAASAAGTLTWDAVNNGPVIDEGAGTWDNSAIVWNNGLQSVRYASGSDVIFGGGGTGTSSYKLTFDGANLNASTLTFNPGAFYRIENPNGNRSIVLSGGLVTVKMDAVVDATISTPGSLMTKEGSGTLELVRNAGFVSSGTVRINAGKVRLNGDGVDSIRADRLEIASGATAQLVVDHQIRNTATVDLAGTLDLGVRNEFIDTLNLNGGTVSGTGKLTLLGGFNLQSGLINAKVENGSINKTTAGTAILNADHVSAGAININAGTLQVGSGGNSGKLGSGAVSIASGATLAFNRNDIAPVVNNSISGQGGVENRGSGTITLNGNNSYTGGTTLLAGILVLGNSSALPAGGDVRLNGGTLELNNQNVPGALTLGTLNLLGDSAIRLDPTSGTPGSLAFATAYRSDGILSIFGWTGSAVHPGSNDRIFINGGASSDFLDNVRFYSGLDTSSPIGTRASLLNGELVPDFAPVPEPVNLALAVFGTGFAAASIIRRRRSGRSLPPNTALLSQR